MRLLEAQLTNFRCFESLRISFDAEVKVHVFVGDNGAGKSAILDAIAMGLAPIARRFGQVPGGRKRGVLDIMEEPRHAKRGLAVFDDTPPKPFSHLSFKGRPNGEVIEWDLHLLRDRSRRTKQKLPTFRGLKRFGMGILPLYVCGERGGPWRWRGLGLLPQMMDDPSGYTDTLRGGEAHRTSPPEDRGRVAILLCSQVNCLGSRLKNRP